MGEAEELKQFRLLSGRPLIAWPYEVLAARCDPVVVVVPIGSSAVARRALGAEAILVDGGSTRAESVRNGLSVVETDYVIIHDAVRPVVSAALIESVIAAVEGADGAIAAVPLEETIKRVAGSHVVATVDRTDLWRAQTPQAFRTSVLRGAHERTLLEGGFDPTDDAQLVERGGGRVLIVEGERTNIKVTWQADFKLAEALLRARR